VTTPLFSPPFSFIVKYDISSPFPFPFEGDTRALPYGVVGEARKFLLSFFLETKESLFFMNEAPLLPFGEREITLPPLVR